MILRQKETRGASLAHPDGEVHEIDVLRPYRLAGCGGDAGRGRGELWGECGCARCIRRPQAVGQSFACGLAPFAHTDGSQGWNPWTTRKQRGRR